MQALQPPAPLHTPPVHAVATGSGAEVLSSQSSTPVVQDVMPAKHSFGFVLHAAPAVQATHAPSLQTSGTVGFSSQVVPSGI